MTGSRTIADQPGVVSLDAGSVQSAALGAKAANLARARAGGLPVIDGFVIPAMLVTRLLAAPRGARTVEVELVRTAWGSLSHRGSDPVVVRSSSVAEDTDHSSQAGVFESVVDVHGWDDFLATVRTVAVSGERAATLTGAAPLAVLVQRHLNPDRSGVVFTVDPVTGRTDHLVVAVVEGGPQGLVGGTESGARLLLDRRARVAEGRRRHPPLPRRERVALVRLARRAEAIFGGPQDIEWAFEGGRLVLLQSRPITAIAAVAGGPVFGPGPLAETFPDQLRPLEADLWLTPLREALRVVLVLTGGAPRGAVGRSPIVIEVNGRPAIDLDVLEGGRARGHHGLALLDPRPRFLRLFAAWQVGRLRSSLPGLIDDLVARLDDELRSVPALDSLDDEALLLLLDRSQTSLRSAHGYELLAGTLTNGSGATASGVALAALTVARRADTSDDKIVASHPAVLALTPPAVGAVVALPLVPTDVEVDAPLHPAMGPREALRLRIRWLHELTARTAWTLGRRLSASGQLPSADTVAALDLATLRHAVRSGEVVDPGPTPFAEAPLPVRFRLASDGSAVPLPNPRRHAEGTGAGGGRGSGLVEHGNSPAPGSVLVVDTLDPRLAPALAGLAGLVAATGSPLSHLAILAREHGVPTVVGSGRCRWPVPAGNRAPRRRHLRRGQSADCRPSLDPVGAVMRRFSLVAVAGVLAVSGVYSLIYLFRWEWHRAIITAVFFVAPRSVSASRCCCEGWLDSSSGSRTWPVAQHRARLWASTQRSSRASGRPRQPPRPPSHGLTRATPTSACSCRSCWASAHWRLGSPGWWNRWPVTPRRPLWNGGWRAAWLRSPCPLVGCSGSSQHLSHRHRAQAERAVGRSPSPR